MTNKRIVSFTNILNEMVSAIFQPC